MQLLVVVKSSKPDTLGLELTGAKAPVLFGDQHV